MADKNLKITEDQRTYRRFNVKRQSVEVEIIIDDYKRLQGISIVDNISLGGMGILIKEALKEGSDIKFILSKNKTIFHGKVVWCRETMMESFPYSSGISFTFPFEDDKKGTDIKFYPGM